MIIVDTLAIYNELRQTLGDQAASKIAQIIQGLYQELSHTVRKEDFDELKAVVKDLAEAQRKTEARLDTLTERIGELAEAQKRFEVNIWGEARRGSENLLILGEAKSQLKK